MASRLRHPTPDTRRRAGLIAVPAAMLAAGLMVWQGSQAAFTAQTRNVGNSWETGNVVLTDDDRLEAAFKVSNLVPGATGSRCIEVTSQSTVTGEVAMYVSRLGADGLENHIIMSNEIGTGGTFDSCDDFVPDAPPLPAQSLAAEAASAYDWATGGLRWDVTGTPGESKSYRVTWTFDTTGLTQAEIDDLQGKSVSVDVIWELRSN